MEAYIKLYEPLYDHLKFKNKDGSLRAFVWIAWIGPVSKICPSERSAVNWLEKHGYRYEFVTKTKLAWVKRFGSLDDKLIENCYKDLHPDKKT